MVGIVSAAGVVGFLSDSNDPELQVFALRTANEGIGLLWTELASSVGQMCVGDASSRSDSRLPPIAFLPLDH